MKTTTAAPASEVFGRYYDSDPAWGGGSGPGSDPYFTIEYRCFLDKFLRMNEIRSVVDVGCGDWSFSRLLDLRGISYLGLEVVPNIVAKNNRAVGSDTCKFELMPESPALVPGADLLVMKDVLQHLPDAEIRSLCRSLIPKFKFALLTNSFRKHGAAHNVHINLGEFRCLDLTAPPFSLNGAYVLEYLIGRCPTLMWISRAEQPVEFSRRGKMGKVMVGPNASSMPKHPLPDPSRSSITSAVIPIASPSRTIVSSPSTMGPSLSAGRTTATTTPRRP